MEAKKFESPELNIEQFLLNNKSLIQKMHFLKAEFNLIPSKEHIGTCINYSDLLEMRTEFIEEIICTVISYVFSKSKQRDITDTFQSEGRDLSSSNIKLFLRAANKFRKNNIAGQFSELLLFNLLQYHFKAVPLIRKMSLTTSPELERNGADAIHIAKEDNEYILYLGEAKTYDRKENSSLHAAIRDSIKSILEHYNNHRNELNLYTYEDFIPKELENIAQSYLNGEIDLKINLVCMITYDNKNEIIGNTKAEILYNITNSISDEIKRMQKRSFDIIPQNLYTRLTYIIFSVNKLKELLNSFKTELRGE